MEKEAEADRDTQGEDPELQEEDEREGRRLNQNAVTVDEALEELGGFGRFQIFIFVAFQLAFYVGGYLIYNLVYLELEPKY